MITNELASKVAIPLGMSQSRDQKLSMKITSLCYCCTMTLVRRMYAGFYTAKTPTGLWPARLVAIRLANGGLGTAG